MFNLVCAAAPSPPTINILWYRYPLSHLLAKNYFLTPRVLFLSLIWLPWHFLHLEEEMGFFAPHLKHILKNSLRCCAICFFVASVIGNIFLRYPCVKAWFVPFYLCDRNNSHIQLPSSWFDFQVVCDFISIHNKFYFFWVLSVIIILFLAKYIMAFNKLGFLKWILDVLMRLELS